MTKETINIYEGEDEVVKYLLNRHSLEDFTTGTHMALVDSIVEKQDKNGKNFFMFNLRDVNGTIVVGRLFDYEEGEDVANTLRKLNKQVARVSYLVVGFNNVLNLNIESITLAPEQFQNINKYFLGEVEGLDELPNKILNFVGSDLTEGSPYIKYINTFKSLHLLSKLKGRSLQAYSWKLGSGLLHIYNTLKTLNSMPLEPEELERLKLIYMVSEAFVNNEKELDEMDLGEGFINNLKVLESLLDSVMKEDSENSPIHKDFKSEVMHNVQVRLGMAEPKTMTTYMIRQADNLVRQTVQINDVHKGMSKGTSRTIMQGKLVKL